jgi:dihydroorotate dehydrogenase (NAD+) catalytic subunit
MQRTSIQLGGVELSSTIMNASGPHSAEKDEIHELSARHTGAIVFKSCNTAGLETPENLKNRGVEHFAALARELAPRGKTIIGSVVGNTDDEIVKVAVALDRAGVKILELNLADDYVQNSVAPFATLERLKTLVSRVRGEVGSVLAVKIPPKLAIEPRAIADLFKSLGVRIAVCANDLPKDLRIDLRSGTAEGAARTLSQSHAFAKQSEGMLNVVAVGGINGGGDAYIAHLAGAKAVQVGSALIKEGADALGRIDRELDALLAERGKGSVSEIIGQLRFAG